MDKTILNRKNIFSQIFPLLYFIVCIGFLIDKENNLFINLIFTVVGFLCLGNIFLQQMAINRVLGFLFLLSSIYMSLALFDDIFDREATLNGGYWVGIILVTISIVMSILMIVGYEEK